MSQSPKSIYDYIIIGAGLAGLHCARRLLGANPALKVLILEKYNYIGGRVVTFRKELPKVGEVCPESGSTKPKRCFGEVQWESGAGRIHESHEMVRSYLKKYKLHYVPISDESWIQWRDGEPLEVNTFDYRIIDSLMPLKFLPDEVLQSSTIEKILTRVIGTKKTKEVTVLLLTKTISNQLTLDVKKANEQYDHIEIKSFDKSHDRFLIIDKTEVYHLGASLKDLGKKWFAFSKMDKSSVASILMHVPISIK